MTPAEVAAARAALAGSEQALAATLEKLDDELAAGASLLPGWTRAVLVRHLAVNARTNATMIESVLHGNPQPQYADEGERERLIEWGRGRSAAEVRADEFLAAAALNEVFGDVTDWTLVVPAGVGPVSIWDRLVARRFEVEVHHADLDLGYRYADWPADFVSSALARVVAGLPSRVRELHAGTWGIAVDGGPSWSVVAAEPVVLVRDGVDEVRGLVEGAGWAVLAWLLGRGSVPSLGLRVSSDEDVANLPHWFPFG